MMLKNWFNTTCPFSS